MRKIKGFTLIELLVVIAIIALLLSVILPSLRAAKELASGVVCTNNQKSLATAWVLYAGDNGGYIPGGSTYGKLDGNPHKSPYRWVEPPLLDPIYGSARAPLTATSLTQEQRLNGIRAGKLFTYIESEKVYHCPGDNNFKNAEPYAAYRSYAITGLMNGEHFIARTGDPEFGEITAYDTWNGKDLKVAIKISDVKSPGSKLVFMEEDPVSKLNKQQYNKGSWVLRPYSAWWDSPAAFHNEGGTFSYADGHAERRKWRDKDTVTLAETGTGGGGANNEDLIWLSSGYIPMP